MIYSTFWANSRTTKVYKNSKKHKLERALIKLDKLALTGDAQPSRIGSSSIIKALRVQERCLVRSKKIVSGLHKFKVNLDKFRQSQALTKYLQKGRVKCNRFNRKRGSRYPLILIKPVKEWQYGSLKNLQRFNTIVWCQICNKFTSQTQIWHTNRREQEMQKKDKAVSRPFNLEE